MQIGPLAAPATRRKLLARRLFAYTRSVIAPSLFAWLLVIALGLILGSFLNVCISRLPLHRSIVKPASHCTLCQAPVRPRDNVPVVSWLLLLGRCRDCGQAIAVRYPLVEAGYAALCGGCIARFGWSLDALAAAVFCFLSLGLLVMDLETMLLPDSFTLPGIALGLVWAFFAPMMDPGDLFGVRWSLAPRALTGGASALGVALLASAGWALVLLIIRWTYYAVRRRHGLGLGDVKLVAMLAAWLGVSKTALAFLLAVVGASVFGLAAQARQARVPGSSSGVGRTRARSLAAVRLPLGAFLCGGALYALFLGGRTLQWYFSFWP